MSDDLLDKAGGLVVASAALGVFCMVVGAVTGLVWLIEWWSVNE